MTDKVITLADPTTGHVSRYRRYSSRLPEFLQSYGPAAGYRIEIKHTDLLSLQPGRLFLLREAVIAGKTPSEIGLPGIEHDVNTLVCTATLVDAQGGVVRSASASAKILGFKDFEALETAANQRLLAALGFGGEIFDDDEDRDLQTLGRTHDATEAGPVPTPTAPTSRPTATVGTLTTTEDEASITDAEHQHIAQLAKRANAPVPVLKNRADVKAAQEQLTTLIKQRRTDANTQAPVSDLPPRSRTHH